MDYKKYERILKNIINKAPIETGVQTLVYMLLDEIIHDKYKQKNSEDKVSVLVADLRKGKDPLFGGNGGVVDLCVVNKFKYVKAPLNEEDIDKWENAKIRRIFYDYDCWEEQQKQEKQNKEVVREEGLLQYRKKVLKEKNAQWKEKFEEQMNNRKGCVEIKATNIQLPESGKILQIAGNIYTFKKVIYTNGLVWLYFDASKINDVDVKTIEAVIKHNLKAYIEGNGKGEDNILSNNAGFVWKVSLLKGNITHTTDRTTEIEVVEEEFNDLIGKLEKIEWV